VEGLVSMNAITLVPDTNVWRYLVDAGAIEDVRLAAKRLGVTIVACPAVLYECLRVRNTELRRRLARALTQNDWFRPMPEAFVEAEAVRHEITRLHPEWVAIHPDLRNYNQNRADWGSGFWRRVRRDPRWTASILSQIEGDVLDRARQQADTARLQARELGQSEQSLRLDNATAWFGQSVAGWDGKPFEAWRGQSQSHWWEAVVLEQNQTATDWLAPWLDLPRVKRERDVWVHMWTREVVTRHVPREWVRWAMSEAQPLRKVTTGTPVDNQISTYLVDFDVFLTSDRAFGESLEVLRPHAPVPLAKIETAPGGPAAADFTLDLGSRLAGGALGPRR
jgi:hypothetical protein